jgi:hypothetical protein
MMLEHWHLGVLAGSFLVALACAYWTGLDVGRRR